MAAGILRDAWWAWRVMAVVFALLLMCAMGCNGSRAALASADTAVIELAGETFTLKLAVDDDQRYQGLSDVAEIPPDGGMLFVFPDAGQRVFVMRRCLVPIDLIYVGPGGRIVSMHEMQLEPYDTPESQLKQYASGWPAQFAIELREGSIQRLKLKPGMKVDMPLADLKAMAE